jgi:hypothetical protein
VRSACFPAVVTLEQSRRLRLVSDCPPALLGQVHARHVLDAAAAQRAVRRVARGGHQHARAREAQRHVPAREQARLARCVHAHAAAGVAAHHGLLLRRRRRRRNHNNGGGGGGGGLCLHAPWGAGRAPEDPRSSERSPRAGALRGATGRRRVAPSPARHPAAQRARGGARAPHAGSALRGHGTAAALHPLPRAPQYRRGVRSHRRRTALRRPAVRFKPPQRCCWRGRGT